MTTIILATFLLNLTPTPNAWDKAALTFDIIGCVGVAPTVIVGTISEYYPSWKPAKTIVSAVTVGSIAAGWTLQGIAAWSHLPTPTGDDWLDKHTPLHILGSTGTVGGIYALSRACRMSKRDALISGTAGALIAGAGIECWQQWSGRGRVSWKDLTTNAASIAITSLALSRL
jgi:hypothetical protein